MAGLPEFVKPMLAKLGQPFSAEDWIFEIKWDGTRALTFLDGPGEYRQVNRNQRVLKERYPELAAVAELAPGVVLDGEIVVLKDDKPDFESMLKREQARSERRIAQLAHSLPAIYVPFDLLYRDFGPVMAWPLSDRRDALREVLEPLEDPRIVFSDGVVGEGERFFEEACAQELEGVVGKRLASKYHPGRRTESWVKVKRRQTIFCAIIGFLPEGDDDLKSLLLASPVDGTLRYVGRVGTGYTDRFRRELCARLYERVRDTAVVPAPGDAVWVEPDLFCSVTYLEKTRGGELRAPAFGELLEG